MGTSILKHMASLALASGAVLSAVQAQEALELHLEPDPAAVTAGFGLFEHGGIHTAHGPDYRALFGPRGIQFVPALGDRVVDEVFLGFELESIHLGDRAISFDPWAAPERDGERVVYPRGSVRERYEATAQGVELSFEFAELPDVDGDLIVRGRITGDLLAQTTGGERLEFLTHEGVGVYMGGVLGIDAQGTTRKGSRELSGQTLELRLPAEFVRGAAFPLVLDPLIGTAFDVGTARSATEIDISYDETTGHYAVVFERSFGINSVHVYAQRVGTSGVLIGGPAPISSPDGTGSGVNSDPCIANLRGNSRFVVAWQRAASSLAIPEIRVTSASAGSLALGPIVAVPKQGVESHTSPDIGGDSGSAGVNCMLVYVALQRVHSARITATSTATTIASPVPLSIANNLASLPAISRACTPSATYLVAYRIPTLDGRLFVQARILRIDGILGSTYSVGDTNGTVTGLDVDGGFALGSGSRKWLVVYDSEPYPPTQTYQGMRGVQLEQLSSDPFQFFPSHAPFSFESNVVGDRSHPSVCFTSSAFHVAYSRQNPDSLLHRVQLAQVSPTTNQFGLETSPPGTTTSPRQVALCGQASAFSDFTTSQDRALLAYRVDALSGGVGGGVAAQSFESFGSHGTVSQYLPACNNGGGVGANTLPDVGTMNFSVSLQNADPFPHLTVLNLVLGAPLTFPCGDCSFLVPQVLTYVSAVGGDAMVTFAIPFQPTWIGTSFYAQYLRLGVSTSGCPESGGLGGSDAIRMVLGG